MEMEEKGTLVMLRMYDISIIDACRATTSSEQQAQERCASLLAKGYLSKRDAMETGSKTYYVGKECKYGHLARRFVSTSGCCECGRIRTRNATARKAAERAREMVEVREFMRREDAERVKEFIAALKKARLFT